MYICVCMHVHTPWCMRIYIDMHVHVYISLHVQARSKSGNVKIDLREGGEAAATVFGKYDSEQDLRGTASFEHSGAGAGESVFDGAAGLTSKQVHIYIYVCVCVYIYSTAPPG